MAKARLTSRGQTTVPKQVRDRLGLQPGDEIEFVEEAGVFRLVRTDVGSPFDKWVGFLREYAGSDSDELVEEMRGR